MVARWLFGVVETAKGEIFGDDETTYRLYATPRTLLQCWLTGLGFCTSTNTAMVTTVAQ